LLGERGVRLKDSDERQRPVDGVFAGKTVVITGRLESMTRGQAQELLRRAGATITSSVSRKTDFVIVGEDPGSKADLAHEYGITILQEAALLERLRGTGATDPA
jgi:DNA ligase (NAD+)